MPEAISNTSPLLYLYRGGVLAWLPQLFNETWIPKAVVLELEEDTAYDGKVFNIALNDVPERKDDLVAGRYELPAPKGGDHRGPQDRRYAGRRDAGHRGGVRNLLCSLKK